MKMRIDETAIQRLMQMRRDGEPILPIKVPPHYMALVQEEMGILGEIGGPLYLVVFPTHKKFDLRAPHETINFVEDLSHMPPGLEGVIVHRYKHKLLYFPTDQCVGNCMYCFRQDITGSSNKQGLKNVSDATLDKVVEYLHQNPEVHEVIFSGGDPLSVPPQLLQKAFERISRIDSVKWLRVHTKTPIFNPKVLRDETIDLFAHHKVRVVVHAVHPYELPDKTMEKLALLTNKGVAVYNQFPILRGVNDHSDVILELAYRLAEAQVQMLTMYITDPIKYGAVYRLRLQRIFDIANEIFLKGAAWSSNFRVCLDTPHGKVKREHIIEYDPKRDIYVFQRDGKHIIYHDIPKEMDTSTPVERLFYKGRKYT